MKNQINYEFKFDFSNGKNFIDCFSSAYDYLMKDDENLARYNQCDWLFFFGTLSGQNMTRLPYNEAEIEQEWLVSNTETQIGLIWGFSSYDHKMITEKFKEEISASINTGKPVIAKLKGQAFDCFRLITGCDGEYIVCPNDEVKAGDFEYLYIFGEKTERKYTLIDGLKQMKKVLDYNCQKDLWGGVIEKFTDYWDKKLNKLEFDEIRNRFNRTAYIMWHTFNCHNLGCAMDMIKNSDYMQNLLGVKNIEKYKHVFALISDACFTTHLNAWIPIEINKLINWNRDNRDYNSEWALSNVISGAIKAINHYDNMLLEAVNEIILIMEK